MGFIHFSSTVKLRMKSLALFTMAVESTKMIKYFTFNNNCTDKTFHRLANVV